MSKALLTEYQKEHVEDRSRFIYELWCRQAGKDFSSALASVLDCYERKTDWVMLAAGEGQTREWIDQAATHARAIDAAANLFTGREKDTEGIEYLKMELRFPNGSRILGLPANPRTARGHSANIILNEFAFHQDSFAIWRAVFGTVTRGYRMKILTTPNGKKNMAYNLWQADNGYVKRTLTIYDAVARGLELKGADGEPCTPEDLKKFLSDDEGWMQEYMLDFLDEVSAWLTYELISQVEAAECVKRPAWVEELVRIGAELFDVYIKSGKEAPDIREEIARSVLGEILIGELFVGYDVARTRDLSVIWLLQKVGTVLVTEAVIEMKRLPFFIQKFILHTLMSLPNVRRACIDQSGIGRQIAEETVLKFSSRAEGIDFTAANKEVLAGIVKQKAEDKLIRIPADPVIRQSLHSVKRYQTATGHFRFDAERTEKTGHADMFWALGLALQAASTNIAPASGGRDPGHGAFAAERKGFLAGIMSRFARPGRAA